MPEKISTPAGRVTAPGRCASPPLSPTVEGMTTENAPSGTIRSALRYPGFRWLLSGLAVSQTGDWLYNLALVVLVYQRTHSACGSASPRPSGSCRSWCSARWAACSPTGSTGAAS
jgi:hypothetical protein